MATSAANQEKARKVLKAIEDLRYRQCEQQKKKSDAIYLALYESISETYSAIVTDWGTKGSLDFADMQKALTLKERKRLKSQLLAKGSSAIVRPYITRMDALILLCKAEAGHVSDEMAIAIEEMFREQIATANSRIGNNLAGVGIASENFTPFGEDEIDEMLLETWRDDGLSWQDVMERDKVILNSSLSRTFKTSAAAKWDRSMALGQVEREIRARRNSTNRIIFTDSVLYGGVAQRETYKGLDIEKCVYTAVLDNRTSEICRSLDGTVLLVVEAEPFVNAPPMHDCCRSYLVPLLIVL